MVDLHCPTPRPRPIPIECVQNPMEISIGLEVGAMKTFPHIIIESNSIGLCLGLGVRQCRYDIMAYLHWPTPIHRPRPGRCVLYPFSTDLGAILLTSIITFSMQLSVLASCGNRSWAM